MKGLTTMKRHRHTPEQILRKVREGDRLLNEGKDIAEVVRHLEIAESTGIRWRSQYVGIDEVARDSASGSAMVVVRQRFGQRPARPAAP